MKPTIMSFSIRSSFRWLVLLVAAVAACNGEREPASTPAPTPDSGAVAAPPADTVAPPAPADTGMLDQSAVTISPGGLPDSVRKYEVKSAVVEYWNSWLDRRQTLYVDKYGAHEAYYTEANPGSTGPAPPYDVSIYADGWRYDYSTQTRTGTRQQKELASGPLLGVVQDVWALPEQFQEEFKLKKLGRKKLAGKVATGYSFEFNGVTTVWLWKGIPLLVEMQRGVQGGGTATITFEARHIETNVAVPAEKFKVPAGITLR